MVEVTWLGEVLLRWHDSDGIVGVRVEEAWLGWGGYGGVVYGRRDEEGVCIGNLTLVIRSHLQGISNMWSLRRVLVPHQTNDGQGSFSFRHTQIE